MASNLHRVLCPIDFSEPSLAAMRWAAVLAGRLGADLDVLHVWNAPAYAGTDKVLVQIGGELVSVSEYTHREAVRQLGEALEQARKILPRAGSRIAEGDARKIVTELSPNYELIVMSTHGRSGVARVVLGSVAEYVLRHAACPVLTMKPHPEPEADKKG